KWSGALRRLAAMPPFLRRNEGSRAQSSRRSGVEPHDYLTPLGVDSQFYAGGFSQWSQSTIKNQPLLLSRLHHNRRPISQYLGNALHNLGSVIPRPTHSVPTQFGRVLQHKFKSFQTGLLPQVWEQRDVAADERLQAGANSAE